MASADFLAGLAGLSTGFERGVDKNRRQRNIARERSDKKSSEALAQQNLEAQREINRQIRDLAQQNLEEDQAFRLSESMRDQGNIQTRFGMQDRHFGVNTDLAREAARQQQGQFLDTLGFKKDSLASDENRFFAGLDEQASQFNRKLAEDQHQFTERMGFDKSSLAQDFRKFQDDLAHRQEILALQERDTENQITNRDDASDRAERALAHSIDQNPEFQLEGIEGGLTGEMYNQLRTQQYLQDLGKEEYVDPETGQVSTIDAGTAVNIREARRQNIENQEEAAREAYLDRISRSMGLAITNGADGQPGGLDPNVLASLIQVLQETSGITDEDQGFGIVNALRDQLPPAFSAGPGGVPVGRMPGMSPGMSLTTPSINVPSASSGTGVESVEAARQLARARYGAPSFAWDPLAFGQPTDTDAGVLAAIAAQNARGGEQIQPRDGFYDKWGPFADRIYPNIGTNRVIR